MKSGLNRTEVNKHIQDFFQRGKFSAEEVSKIKRLAMKYNIKLGIHRRRFCKRCLSLLKGNVHIHGTHKTIICASCGHRNRWVIKKAQAFLNLVISGSMSAWPNRAARQQYLSRPSSSSTFPRSSPESIRFLYFSHSWPMGFPHPKQRTGISIP